MPITGGIAAPTIIPLKVGDKDNSQGCIDTQTYIEIVSETPNARLYFTTNGSNPNPWKRKVNGREVTFVYKAPFALRPGRRVVKAMAVHSVTNVESHTVTRKFHVLEANSEESPQQSNKQIVPDGDADNASDILDILDNYDTEDEEEFGNVNRGRGDAYTPAILQRRNNDFTDDIVENFMRRNADQGFAATNHSGTQINLWGQMPGLNWDVRTPNSANISGSYPLLNNYSNIINGGSSGIPFWSSSPLNNNIENTVSPQQLSTIANHLTQCIDRTRQMTVEEVRGLMKQLTDKFSAKDNGDLYNMANQPVSGGGNAIEQIERVKNHLIKYVKQDKDFSVAISQAKIGNVISADFDESDDSYLLTIHLDKPIKTEQPTKTSRRPSENKQSQRKPTVPTKSVTPNKPSSPASGSVPNSPEKTSQADSIPEEIKAAHDRYREVEEYPLEPTLKPSPDFDPDKDCEKLHQAMAGMGTNEKAVIEIMGHRSSEQRVVITQRYKSIFGKDLTSKFKSEMSGALYDCMKALCYSPVELDARELRRAVEGAGTDEDALIEILCSRTNDQIKQIKETYTKVFPNRDLENDIKGDTSRHFKRVCVALLQANRDESTKVDTELARRDAESLYRAGEQKLGTDESKFVQILVSRSYAHLRLVFEEYTTIGKRNIEDTLKAEMHGDTLRAFLSIVSCIKNKPKYFAEKLHKSMKGLGTDNKTLIRIIVSRCEIDLGIIKKEFQSLTGKTLEAYIHDDTSGDFRLILLALVGA
ncbi:unnamed protein product [Trichobilharzia szidati]|nr:unnamed protein product [Trichobilharzia szidati]